ncbi:UNVERIFIED_CONTAM: hypothetical protein K2H54_048125 [Gekko kuhli]
MPSPHSCMGKGDESDTLYAKENSCGCPACVGIRPSPLLQRQINLPMQGLQMLWHGTLCLGDVLLCVARLFCIVAVVNLVQVEHGFARKKMVLVGGFFGGMEVAFVLCSWQPRACIELSTV